MTCDSLFGWCYPFGLSTGQFWLAWLALGFLTAGLIIPLRQIPVTRAGRPWSMTAIMGCCLVCWWFVAFVSALWLLGLLCYALFNPDSSPVAMLVAFAKAVSVQPVTPAPQPPAPPPARPA